MRKANKIMMITVSVLLSAVLLTTSALSGTLAKYTTSATAHSESARVAKWGVTVEAKVSDELIAATNFTPKAGTENTWQKTEISVDLGEFGIKPGDYYSEAISFTFSGTAEVKLDVRIYIDMYYSTAYTSNGFGVKKEFSGYKDDDSFMPMGLNIGSIDTNGNRAEPHLLLPSWYTGAQFTSEVRMSREICNFIDTAYDSKKITPSGDNATTAEKNTPGYVAKTFNPNDKIVFHPVKSGTYNGTRTFNENVDINTLYVDLYWPIDRGNSEVTSVDFDALTTYFEENKGDLTVSAKFIIVIEQVQ